MLLVLSPLGLGEIPDCNELAIDVLSAMIEGYRMQGKGVPRYETHIAMMSQYLDEFTRQHEVTKEYGRDPRRNLVMQRENTPAEEAYLMRF